MRTFIIICLFECLSISVSEYICEKPANLRYNLQSVRYFVQYLKMREKKEKEVREIIRSSVSIVHYLFGVLAIEVLTVSEGARSRKSGIGCHHVHGGFGVSKNWIYSLAAG